MNSIDKPHETLGQSFREVNATMQFTAYVEIHRTDRETYERLHQAMAAEFFSRVLTDGKTGKKYEMPLGHYWKESTMDRWAVLAAAERAALPIDPRARIVVSGSGEIVFNGNCPEVAEDQSSGLYGAFLAQLAREKSIAQMPIGGFYGTTLKEQPRMAFQGMNWIDNRSRPSIGNL